MPNTRILWSICMLSVLGLAGDAITAQSPSPAFEVASIKPNRSSNAAGGFTTGGGRWQMVNKPIQSLILSAYPTVTFEIVGAPDWVTSEMYDVTAKAAGNPSDEQMMLMLRSLLAERFKFAAHYQKVERPAYALVVANKDRTLGPQLRRATVDCAALVAANPTPGQNGRPALPLASNGAPVCTYMLSGPLIVSGGRPIATLTGTLTSIVGRVVIDKTELAGNYEFTLRYSQSGVAAASGNAPSIFTALQEQLGLKLEPQRTEVDVVVIDHIERPTED
jgi:uncharacterized protein (TIGR03435 family)